MRLTILLNMPNGLTFLVGREFAESIFNEQVKSLLMVNIDRLREPDSQVVIVYPDYVNGIAISFTKGMISAIYNTIGRELADRVIRFETNKISLNNKIIRDMEF